MDISIKLNFIRLEPNFFKTLLLIAWALKQPVTFTRLVDPSCKMNVMVLLESFTGSTITDNVSRATIDGITIYIVSAGIHATNRQIITGVILT